MSKFLIRALLLLPLIGTVVMADTIFPYRYQKETLPNGLTVIMIPMESPGLVAYYSVVRTGSRDEVEPGKSGFAHFFEHMMFRGTKKYPGSVYDSVITSIGANANAYTTDDYTAYHLELASEDLQKVIEMESDRFQNLSYAEREFQTEAGAVYGEYRKSITSPFAVLNEKMQNLAYDVHTYKHTTIGFEADIKAMPEAYEYSKSFFNRFYRPENVVLLIAGDIDQQKTIAMVKQYYGGWSRGYTAPAVTPEPPQHGERKADIDYPGRTLPILDIAFKGDAYNPGNTMYVAATVLADLAFGETSEIYKKLVVNEQRVQMLSASTPVNRDAPLFEIYSMVKKADDVAAVRDEIFTALEQFKKTPVDAKRLDDLKRRNKYSFLMALSTPDHVAGGLARFAALTGSIETVNDFYAALDKVTAEDVMHAAQKYFVPESRSVIVLKGAK
jgi:zinc protease